MHGPSQFRTAGWVLLLVLPLWAAGCRDPQRRAPPAAGKVNFAGQTLRLYNFPNYLSKGAVASFEERTGCKITVENYASNEDLIRGLEAGGKWDVVFPSSYAVERIIRQGRIKEMDRNRVPNLIQVPDRFRNPPVDPSLRHCVPYTWSMTGLGLYAPSSAQERAPDSMEALFAERGPKVLMLDDMRATVGVALRFLGLSASTQKAEELDKAKALLLGQSSRVLRYVADAGPALLSGQAHLALAWSGDVLEASAKNPDVRFLVPREGTLLYVDYACVPETAQSVELAFAFLNHLLDPQIAADFTNTMMFATPNLGAQRLLHQDARWLWATLDAVKDQGRFEMLRDVGPAMPLYEAVWKELRTKAEFKPN